MLPTKTNRKRANILYILKSKLFIPLMAKIKVVA